MKKILFVLLGVFLIFGISYAAEPEDFLGNWFSKYISYEGIKVEAQMFDLSYKIEISEDKIILSSSDGSKEGPWEQQSESSIIAKFPDGDIEMILEDDSLTIDAEGAILYFYKSSCTCDCESLQAQIDKLTDELRVLKGEFEVKDPSEIPSIEDHKHIIIHDFTLDYQNFELDKTEDGEDIVYIYYTFTNYSDKTTSFTTPLYRTAFQDGIQLESNISSYGTENNTQIRPGKSIDVRDSFYLRDLTNPLELEYDESFSWTNDYKSIRLLDIK